MDIGDLVSITVSRTTQAPSEVGFQTIGLLAYHTAFADYAREYNANAAGLTQLIADGLDANSPAYHMMASVVAQSPHPKTVRVLKRDTPFVHAVELEPDDGGAVPAAGKVITVTIEHDGDVLTYNRTSLGGTKNAEAIAIAAAINADAAGWGTAGSTEFTCVVSGAGAGDRIEIDANGAGNHGKLWWYSDIDYMLYENITPDPGLATDLATIVSQGSNDFYAVALDSKGQGEIAGLAAWVETNLKIHGYSSKDYDIPTVAATDIMTTLSGLNYDRSFGLSFDDDHDESSYSELAWMAYNLSEDPGGKTWAYTADLSGVVASPWTGAQEGYIEGKEGNHYTTTAGIDHTFPGKVASGEFIDIITLTDWAVARIQEAVFGLFVGQDKVPFTEKGVRDIKAAAFSVLQRQMKDDDSGGFIKGSETFDAPAVADVSTANKTTRYMPDIVVGALFTNAIHTVGIELTLTF